jgi:ribosomal protein S18 acetylase RimI-like enzyme
MIIVKRFETADAQAVSALIAKTLRITNSKDYSSEELERLIGHLTPEKLIERAGWTHFYVLCDGEKIVGCGAIGPYWGSETESSLFNIFVDPEYQGKGLGRTIIETLEADDYALRAKRIEVPASITACQFYRRLGYDYKDGINALDEDRYHRLEKIR